MKEFAPVSEPSASSPSPKDDSVVGCRKHVSPHQQLRDPVPEAVIETTGETTQVNMNPKDPDPAPNRVSGQEATEDEARRNQQKNSDQLGQPRSNGKPFSIADKIAGEEARPLDDFAPAATQSHPSAATDHEAHPEPVPSFETGGIRWAPLNVPFERRLQTLVVLFHCLSIAITLSLFCFACVNPLLWPIVIVYMINLLFSTAHCDGTLSRRSTIARRLPVWNLFASYFPARLHKTANLPPARKYIFGYHPHGIISHGAWAAFATEAVGFSELFPGITNTLLTLDSNFRIPFYRDYILAMGLGSVSKESITNTLTKGGRNREGMGRAVTIVVGGARESLEARPGNMSLVLKDRKGFIRMAIRTGADIVPVLGFGENDLYDQLDPKEHPAMRKFQMWVLRAWKFTLPFLHGRGIFNYDVGMMPYRHSLNIVVGRPVKVEQAPRDRGPDNDEVDRLHTDYVTELERLWHMYKDRFAKSRTSDMKVLD